MRPSPLILALILSGPTAAAVEIPATLRHLTPPKGVTLNAEEQKLLDLANASLAQGYRLLIDQNAPGRAAEEFRKALVIQNRIATLVKKKMDVAGLGTLDNETKAPETPRDKIESRGGIERIVELTASGGHMETPQAEYDIQKRKVIKDSARAAKDIDATQKQITTQLKMNAGGGGGGKKEQEQKQKQEDQEPPQEQPAGQPPHGPNQAQAEATGKPPKDDPKADGKPPAPGGQPPPERSGEATGKATGQQQKNPDGKQNPAGKPGAKAAGGQGGGGGQDQPKDVAAQQERVAKALEDIADKLTRQGGGTAAERATAEAFHHAAAAAGDTARAMAQKNVESAIAASQNAERAIAEALAKIDASGTAALQQAVGALGQELAQLQGQQDKLIAQTRALGQGNDERDAELDRDRATRLMGEEGQIKERIEQLQKTIRDLTDTIDQHNAGALTPETAAREGVGRAGQKLDEGALRQHAIDATMKLGQGDLGGALTAMAGVQQEANAVRRDIDLANQALAGGAAEQMERDLSTLQRLASDLHRLAATAQALAGQGKNGKPDANAPDQGQPQGPAGPGGGAGAKDGSHTGGEDQATLSESMAKVVNGSADAIRQELAQLAPRLPGVTPDLSGQLLALTAKPAAFDRRFAESLKQLDELAATVEKLAGVMGRSLEREQEKSATRDFLKDPIPPAYQAAVAAYLEELSKGAEKR
jgi:hypothetical protein